MGTRFNEGLLHNCSVPRPSHLDGHDEGADLANSELQLGITWLAGDFQPATI
jgi:hypothetical protein